MPAIGFACVFLHHPKVTMALRVPSGRPIPNNRILTEEKIRGEFGSLHVMIFKGGEDVTDNLSKEAQEVVVQTYLNRISLHWLRTVQRLKSFDLEAIGSKADRDMAYKVNVHKIAMVAVNMKPPEHEGDLLDNAIKNIVDSHKTKKPEFCAVEPDMFLQMPILQEMGEEI